MITRLLLTARRGAELGRVIASSRIYLRITDNWLELPLRFLVTARGVRDVKDRMNRQILDELDAADIGIASTTYDIVGLPPVKMANASSD